MYLAASLSNQIESSINNYDDVVNIDSSGSYDLVNKIILGAKPDLVLLANYNLKDKKQGAWHHDASADISMVVPLNTGEYEGGGTEFFNRGTIYPLPTGNAMIFPSFTHMHRGLPVESGDRYLLVFWLKSDAENA